MFDFEEKVLLVTGAASGIGRATAEYFFNCGASVFLADLNANLVAELAAKMDPSGARVVEIHFIYAPKQLAVKRQDVAYFGARSYPILRGESEHSEPPNRPMGTCPNNTGKGFFAGSVAVSAR